MTTISFQGEAGAYSHLACSHIFPEAEFIACPSFADALNSVSNGQSEKCVVPVENSVAGRVGGLHRLIPEANLYVVGEYFQPIRHVLMASPGSQLSDLREVWSHPQALAQCRKTLECMELTPLSHPDTAGAARQLSQEELPHVGVIASEMAARAYGLDIIQSQMEDSSHNMTRFLILAREPLPGTSVNSSDAVTSLLFRLRSVPAALYKALGGFATNGINLTRIESYLEGGSFEAARFYIDAEGHWEEPAMKLAVEELRFFCETDGVQWLGTYPAHPMRQIRKNEGSQPN